MTPDNEKLENMSNIVSHVRRVVASKEEGRETPYVSLKRVGRKDIGKMLLAHNSPSSIDDEDQSLPSSSTSAGKRKRPVRHGEPQTSSRRQPSAKRRPVETRPRLAEDEVQSFVVHDVSPSFISDAEIVVKNDEFRKEVLKIIGKGGKIEFPPRLSASCDDDDDDSEDDDRSDDEDSRTASKEKPLPRDVSDRQVSAVTSLCSLTPPGNNIQHKKKTIIHNITTSPSTKAKPPQRVTKPEEVFTLRHILMNLLSMHTAAKNMPKMDETSDVDRIFADHFSAYLRLQTRYNLRDFLSETTKQYGLSPTQYTDFFNTRYVALASDETGETLTPQQTVCNGMPFENVGTPSNPMCIDSNSVSNYMKMVVDKKLHVHCAMASLMSPWRETYDVVSDSITDESDNKERPPFEEIVDQDLLWVYHQSPPERREVISTFLACVCNARKYMALGADVNLETSKNTRQNALRSINKRPLYPVHMFQREPLHVDLRRLNALDVVFLLETYHPLVEGDIVFVNVDDSSVPSMRHTICRKEAFTNAATQEMASLLYPNYGILYKRMMKSMLRMNNELLRTHANKSKRARHNNQPYSFYPVVNDKLTQEMEDFNPDADVFELDRLISSEDVRWMVDSCHNENDPFVDYLSSEMDGETYVGKEYTHIKDEDIFGATIANFNTNAQVAAYAFEKALGVTECSSIYNRVGIQRLCLYSAMYCSEVAPSTATNTIGKPLSPDKRKLLAQIEEGAIAEKDDDEDDDFNDATYAPLMSIVGRSVLNHCNRIKSEAAEESYPGSILGEYLVHYLKSSSSYIHEAMKLACSDTHDSQRSWDFFSKLRNSTGCKTRNRSTTLDSFVNAYDPKKHRNLNIFNILGMVLENLHSARDVFGACVGYYSHFNLQPPVLLADLCLVFVHANKTSGKDQLHQKYLLAENCLRRLVSSRSSPTGKVGECDVKSFLSEDLLLEYNEYNNRST